MLRTIFDVGFIKISLRRCYRFHAIRWPFSSSSLPACAEIGKIAPDVSIYNIHGHPQRLHEYIQALPADCPLVLNFGSYTWPPFAGNVAAMVDIYRSYCCQPDIAKEKEEEVKDKKNIDMGKDKKIVENNDEDTIMLLLPPVARFLTVYLEEAHAVDEWYLPDAKGAQPGNTHILQLTRNPDLTVSDSNL